MLSCFILFHLILSVPISYLCPVNVWDGFLWETKFPRMCARNMTGSMACQWPRWSSCMRPTDTTTLTVGQHSAIDSNGRHGVTSNRLLERFFNQKFAKVNKKPIKAPHYWFFSVRNPPPSTMARDSPHKGSVMLKVLPCHDVMNWKWHTIYAVFRDCCMQSLSTYVLPQIALINVLSVAKMTFVFLIRVPVLSC